MLEDTPPNTKLTCRGRLRRRDAAQNRDGGPGHVQRIVRRL